MKQRVIDTLNQLNKDFYVNVAEDFSRTRQAPWEGWFTFAKLLKSSTDLNARSISVLDIGCGNGRFGKFLLDQGFSLSHYVGVDSNEVLLEKACESLGVKTPTQFIHQDFVSEGLPDFGDQKFDMVVLFGVIHHVPGFDNRLKLLKKAANLVKPGGFLAVSFWQYHKDPRFEHKVVGHALAGIDSNDLEKNDFVLTWNNDAKLLRYAHVFDQKEIDQYVSEVELKLIDGYAADGKTANNKYCVWLNEVTS